MALYRRATFVIRRRGAPTMLPARAMASLLGHVEPAPKDPIFGVADVTDHYEATINSLPSAVNEFLLRIFRLGIGSPYDIDIHCIKSLNELPESGAVVVLNQVCNCFTQMIFSDNRF
ncbi:Heterogeneous nuclear ribonucleoprotein A1 [Hordeum vulgare]|nr:Heterogeneous nuclear ribonucleoprotein A1 [Hordeum vulgare]